jgi:hypothetical protein
MAQEIYWSVSFCTNPNSISVFTDNGSIVETLNPGDIVSVYNPVKGGSQCVQLIEVTQELPKDSSYFTKKYNNCLDCIKDIYSDMYVVFIKCNNQVSEPIVNSENVVTPIDPIFIGPTPINESIYIPTQDLPFLPNNENNYYIETNIKGGNGCYYWDGFTNQPQDTNTINTYSIFDSCEACNNRLQISFNVEYLQTNQTYYLYNILNFNGEYSSPITFSVTSDSGTQQINGDNLITSYVDENITITATDNKQVSSSASISILRLLPFSYYTEQFSNNPTIQQLRSSLPSTYEQIIQNKFNPK